MGYQGGRREKSGHCEANNVNRVHLLNVQVDGDHGAASAAAAAEYDESGLKYQEARGKTRLVSGEGEEVVGCERLQRVEQMGNRGTRGMKWSAPGLIQSTLPPSYYYCAIGSGAWHSGSTHIYTIHTQTHTRSRAPPVRTKIKSTYQGRRG